MAGRGRVGGSGRGGGSISIGPAVVLGRLALNYSPVRLILPRPGESLRTANTDRLTQKVPVKKNYNNSLVPAAHGQILGHMLYVFFIPWEERAY